MGHARVITTNLERLHAGSDALASSLYPHIATNGANLVDVFAAYVTGAEGNRSVTLTEVDP